MSAKVTGRPMLRIAEVCERLSVCDDTVRKLIRTGKLAAAPIAGVWRIDPADLERYIDAQKQARQSSAVRGGHSGAFDADANLPDVEHRFS